MNLTQSLQLLQHRRNRTHGLASTKACLSMGLVMGIFCMIACDKALAQLKIEIAPEYFYWHEKDPQTGRKFLDESGFRTGLEFSYMPAKEMGWLWAGRAKLYYGSVDYNGTVQGFSGGNVPVKATTHYRGALMEGRYGYRSHLGQDYLLDIMGGAGIDYWFRDLPSSSDPSILSYDEYFLPIYLKAGLDVRPKGETGWVAGLGLKAPVYTKQWIKSDLGSVTLNPEMRLSGYAEAGYQFTKHMSAIVFIDSYWFGKSDPVDAGFTSVQQPESYTYSIGLKLGWTF